MARRRLLCFILVTLPLTNSVTLPVGFPLKLYEVAGAIALAGLMLGGMVNLGLRSRIPALWGLFLFSSIFASAWGLYELLDTNVSMLEWAHGRFLPVINTLFQYAYFAFDIGLMVLVLQVLSSGGLTKREFCRWWLYGTALAVGYAVAMNLVLALGLPPLLLLRWDQIQFISVGGFQMARSGPFEEGNYLGWYLLASSVIATWSVLRWDDRFFRLILPVILLGSLISASPVGLLGVLGIFLVAAVHNRAPYWAKIVAVLGETAVIVTLFVTGLFQTLVLDKFSLLFSGGITDVTNVSLVQRLNESYHAWKMFLAHPFGVGLGNFGYFFGQYPDLYPWLNTDFAGHRRIANNIYIEVLAEHGVVPALLFLYLLLAQGRRLWFARERLLTLGYVMTCGYFLAFPTYRMAMVWVFWGMLVYLGKDRASSPVRGS